MAAEARDNEESKEPKKGSPLVKILILVVILAALGGGGFFAYGKFFGKAPAEGDQGQAAPSRSEKQVICDWDTMVVNLADPGGKRYLKLGMKIELNNDRVLEEIKNRSFQIKDAMLMVLSSKEFDDIATPSGKQALKQEMMAQMNKLVKQGQVKDIYFTDFVVQ